MWIDRSEDQDEIREAPTYEDLTIDPDLGSVERFVKYATGAVELQRLVHVMLFNDTVREAGFETAKSELFCLVPQICEDAEAVVRETLAKQLALLCEYCDSLGTPDAYNTMLSSLVPCINTLICDKTRDVRKAASVSLIKVANFIHDTDLMEHVLSIILKLVHDKNDANRRILSASLLNGLAKRFGDELSQQFAVPEIISLSEDPNSDVRKAVPLCMDKIFTVVSSEAIARLFKAYAKLSTDEDDMVRRAAAESLSVISSSVIEVVGAETITTHIERFAKDSHRRVRGTIANHLGRLMVSIPQVPEKIVTRYVSLAKLATDPTGSWINKAPNDKRRRSFGKPVEELISEKFSMQIQYSCAFEFPGVLQHLGAKSWEQISPVFMTFCNSNNKDIRATLACSLHEVSQVVGIEITRKTLMPCLLKYISADSATVTTGALRNMAKILKLFPIEERAEYLPVLVELYHESCFRPRNVYDMTVHSHWRLRHVIAEVVPSLIPLIATDSVNIFLMPLVLQLIYDDVDTVRESSNLIVGPMFDAFAGSEYLETFANQVLQLSTSNRFVERQQFVTICQHLSATNKAPFRKYLFVALLELRKDPVINVRLRLAKCLGELVSHLDSESVEQMQNVLIELKGDSDKDIVDAAEASLSKYPLSETTESATDNTTESE